MINIYLNLEELILMDIQLTFILSNYIFKDKTIERYDPMQNTWWVVRYSCLNLDE